MTKKKAVEEELFNFFYCYVDRTSRWSSNSQVKIKRVAFLIEFGKFQEIKMFLKKLCVDLAESDFDVMKFNPC